MGGSAGGAEGGVLGGVAGGGMLGGDEGERFGGGEWTKKLGAARIAAWEKHALGLVAFTSARGLPSTGAAAAASGPLLAGAGANEGAAAHKSNETSRGPAAAQASSGPVV